METGELLAYRALVGSNRQAVMGLRRTLREDMECGEPRLACALCGVPVVLVAQDGEKRFFFRHTLEDGRCPAETRGRYSQAELDALRYNGQKESRAHQRMKAWVAQCLLADPAFSDVQVEKRWTGALTGEWRQPDVRAVYRGLPVVMEIQLSTTYLNVIVERTAFYQRNGALLLWVFAHFDLQARRLMQDDVFFANNRNAFVVSCETWTDSLAQRRMMLDCIWAMPTGQPVSTLERRRIGFDELTLEPAAQRAWYFDFEGARRDLEAAARARRDVAAAALREQFEPWWLRYQDGREQDLPVWRSLRQQASALGAQLPEWPGMLPAGLLNGLYSAKHGRSMGWRHQLLLQVAHTIANQHRRYLRAFRHALAVYGRGEQLQHEDRSGSWKQRVRQYVPLLEANHPDYVSDTSFDDLLELLFPELFASGES